MLWFLFLIALTLEAPVPVASNKISDKVASIVAASPNSLAGNCTASLKDFKKVYGDDEGFQNFLNTQVGEFLDCLEGKVHSGARTKKKHYIRAPKQNKQNASNHDDTSGSDTAGLRGGFKLVGKGDDRIRGSGNRHKHKHHQRSGFTASKTIDTAVTDEVLAEVKRHIDDCSTNKSQANYYGIRAWHVQKTEREVTGAGFAEQLFGLELDPVNAGIIAQTSDTKVSGNAIQPITFANIIGRRGHRIRCSMIHGQYNQWFQSPNVWDSINNVIQYRRGDIVIATHPKAGTTWTEQIVLLLLAGGDETRVSSRRRHMPSFADSYMLDEKNLFKLWFERDLGKFHQSQNITQHKIDMMTQMPGRRVIKTHAYRQNLLSNNLLKSDTENDSFVEQQPSQDDATARTLSLDPNIKVIYVARNPKDQAMSLFHQEFHFGTLENEIPWPLDAWLRAWFDGVTVYGSWFVSLQGWFEALVHDTKDQLLFLKYEDMIHDHEGAVRKIATHLGLDAENEELIQDVVEKSSMEHVKASFDGKGSKGVIYRKGGIGDWRNTFSADLSSEFDELWRSEMRRHGLCNRERPELIFDVGDGDLLEC